MPFAITAMSKLLANAYEGREDEEDEDTLTVPLGKVNSKMLTLVLDYCKHHKYAKIKTDLDYPLPPGKTLDFLKDPWEREFVEKLELEDVIKLLEAANYMDLAALFEMCCAVIASQFRGKSFDECKKTFGLEDVQYGPAEEE